MKIVGVVRTLVAADWSREAGRRCGEGQPRRRLINFFWEGGGGGGPILVMMVVLG